MYCPKCNAQITKKEKACPVCGVPFIQQITTPPTVPNGTKIINPESVAEAVQSVNLETTKIKQQNPLSIKKEKIKIPKIVKIFIILLFILGMLYFLAFSNIITPNNNESNNNSTNINKIKKYGGYEFEIPDGFTAKHTENGLEIKGIDLYFIIGVDYTNSYKKYLDSFSNKYSTDEETAKKTYNDKDYILFNTKENNIRASIYVTNGKNDTLFIGTIIRKDNKFATDEDIALIFEMLIKATSTKHYKPVEADNLGQYGLKIYQINPVFVDY